MIDLTQLKALEANATDAPWTVNEHSWQESSIWNKETGHTVCLLSIEDDEDTAEEAGKIRDQDAALIAYLRNNAPEIIRRLEAADRIASRAEALTSLLNEIPEYALLELDEDPHQPSSVSVYRDSLSQALAAYRKEGE